MEGDRLQGFIAVFELKRMTSLTKIDDERVATIAEQFNAIRVSEVAGFLLVGMLRLLANERKLVDLEAVRRRGLSFRSLGGDFGGERRRR